MYENKRKVIKTVLRSRNVNQQLAFFRNILECVFFKQMIDSCALFTALINDPKLWLRARRRKQMPQSYVS